MLGRLDEGWPARSVIPPRINNNDPRCLDSNSVANRELRSSPALGSSVCTRRHASKEDESESQCCIGVEMASCVGVARSLIVQHTHKGPSVSD